MESEIVKKKIVIGLPGNNFSSKFLISWTSTLNTLWETGKYDVVVSPGVSSYVSFARMQTLGLSNLRGIDQKAFNGMPFDIFVTIDSDMVFTAQNLIDLIEATDENDVVSGYYRMSDLKNLAIVKDWNISHFKTTGSFKYLQPDDMAEYSKDKYLKVAYCGMGFMALTKNAIDSLNYPYFYTELQEFKGTDGKLIREMCSEDVSFCRNLTKAGFDINVITNLRVGHEKALII
jgi:hypothetical protein|tara:strand:+ start:178 stop:873 length:696 start_codon:yes stop_codon:yes gene_type:complete